MLRGVTAAVTGPISGIGPAIASALAAHGAAITIVQAVSLACYLCGKAAAQIAAAPRSIDGGWTAQ